MPFDPSGNFSRVHSWQQDRDNGIRILADRHDEEDDNFSGAFNLTFLRTGTVPMTGNLVMGGNSIKLIRAGSEAAPSLSWELSNSTGLWSANPNEIDVTIGGTNRLSVTNLGIGVKGQAYINGPIIATGDFNTNGAIVAGNQIQIRDDPSNDYGTALLFYNNDGSAIYGKVSIEPISGEMYLWSNGKGVLATDNVRFTANLNVGGGGNFGTTLSSAWIQSTGDLVAEGNCYFRNVIIRDDASNNRGQALSFSSYAGDVSYASISPNASGDLQLWSQTGWVRSLNNFIAPSIQSDGAGSFATTLWAGGNISTPGNIGANLDVSAGRTLSCAGDLWVTGDAHLNHISLGTGSIDMKGTLYAGDSITLRDVADDKEMYINFYNSNMTNPWGNIGIKANSNLSLWSQYGLIELVSGVQCNGALSVIGTGWFNQINATYQSIRADSGAETRWVSSNNLVGYRWISTANNGDYGQFILQGSHDGFGSARVEPIRIDTAGTVNIGTLSVAGTASAYYVATSASISAGGGVYTQSADGIALNLTDRPANDKQTKIRWTNNAVGVQYGFLGYTGDTMEIYNGLPGNLSLYTNGGLAITMETAGPVRFGNNPWSNYAPGMVRVQAFGGVAFGSDSNGTGDYNPMNMLWNSGASGWITTTGVGTTYNTISDGDLKENIQDAIEAGELLDAIKIRQFDWKNHDVHQRYGTVAQELLDVFPEAVNLGVPPEGEENGVLGVDYSTMIPMLIKEIQGLRRRVAHVEEHVHGPDDGH